MRIGFEIVTYAAFLVVAIAAAAPFILTRLRGDERVLGFLRSRSRPILPINRSELLGQIWTGIRVVILVTVAALITGAFLSRDGWFLVLVFGGMSAPFLTIPMSVAHTLLLRLLGFRGLVVSAAAGVVIGAVVSHFVHTPDFTPPLLIFGGAYGVTVGLRRALFTSPGAGNRGPHEAASLP